MGAFICLKDIISSFRGVIKNRDMYAKQITFTYKGEESFKTFFGGAISLLITAIVIIFGVQRFIVMINRTDASTTFNKSVNSLSDSSYTIDLSQYSFYFALELKYNNKNLLMDSSYFTVSMEVLEEDSLGNSKSTIIPYDYCSKTSYSFDS